jgi:hypothetical protein
MKPIAGQTRFQLEPVKSPRLPFFAEVACVSCGEPVVVPFGAIAATFRIGSEVVGICCDTCLDDKSRAHLERLRQTAAGGKVAP